VRRHVTKTEEVKEQTKKIARSSTLNERTGTLHGFGYMHYASYMPQRFFLCTAREAG
jgi:hypothetical protein